MSKRTRIKILVENSAGTDGGLAEHGLAFWIEYGEYTILFDTGQGKALEHNVTHFGIPLEKTDAVVISHGHFDHTGGLPYALQQTDSANIYLHPDALKPRYSCHEKQLGRSIGIPQASTEILAQHQASVASQVQAREIIPGIWLTGEIPRKTSFEDVGGPFYLDKSCTQPDPILDDQALVIDSTSGWIVLLGCGHAGIVNTMTYAAELTSAGQFCAVLGGMHLLRASQERLCTTAETLSSYQVQTIVPLHCTGEPATRYFWERFPKNCKEGYIGACFEF